MYPFSDHEIGQRAVGRSPGGSDLRRPRVAQAFFQGPEQCEAYHRVMLGPCAISDVTLGQSARGRQDRF
jgi:hypothetical protein